jgi:hypothetical protein
MVKIPRVEPGYTGMNRGEKGRGHREEIDRRLEQMSKNHQHNNENKQKNKNKTDAPADLNGLVIFAERRNTVSARVPLQFN